MESQIHQKTLNEKGGDQSGSAPSSSPGGSKDKVCMHPVASMKLTALPGLPLVRAGDDIADLVCEGITRAGLTLGNGDILVIAQKIISKAENRLARLRDVEPSQAAFDLAQKTGRDPRIVELILSGSEEVLRATESAMIVSNRNGLILANAGIDRSNVCGSDDEDEQVLLLPHDPDATCRRLREEIRVLTGVDMAIIINDSIGRAWRRGSVGLAIGAAGLPSLLDLKGRHDLFDRPLQVSEEAIADELAAAASLMQGQADEGRPVIHISGYHASGDNLPASVLVRPKDQDLFR